MITKQKLFSIQASNIVGLLLILLLIASCSGSKEIVQESIPVEESSEPIIESAKINLSEYKVKPELAFYSIENSIPEVFQVETNQLSNNPNSGFRVQIISTQDVNQAEQVRIEFNTWMQMEVPEYEANAYILFRQPYYKLHVGDFKSRADAIEFGRILKRKFPDAWVVFDDIDPTNITVLHTQN